ncbi:MAG: cytochrome P450 [bacterium]|nr:cytochrome P450 [Gammaproteobacteria bacterium]HIL97815.1 cytochrome P450 [Pseudomonadales bacterium]
MKKLEDYNLFDPETLKCPYEFYERLLEEAPVYELPGMGMALVSGHNLIRDTLRNTRVWSSRVASGISPAALTEANDEISQQIQAIMKTDVALEQTLLSVDPPDHAKHRTLVNKLFAGSRVKTLVPYIDDLVSNLIDGFVNEGKTEFISSFATPLPVTVIRNQMGVPDEEATFFYKAATAAAELLSMQQPTPERALERVQLNHDLQLLFLSICEQRRKEPKDDMLTLLVEAMYEGERPLRDGEILSILNQFLVAGHETTSSALGAGLKLLIDNPEQQQLLRDDPSKIKTFVEEILRLETPVAGLMRIATEDTELGGVSFAKGSVVMLRYAAGNRDQSMFKDAGMLDVCRTNANRQLGFGAGVHACVGAPLARQEMVSAFTQILQRIENIANDPTKPEPENNPSFLLRGLNHLHITFDKK